MTTKQTIDGVSRSLIEMTIDLLQDLRRGTAIERKLRALLDAQHIVCSNGILCQNSKCAECGGNGSYKAPALLDAPEPTVFGCNRCGGKQAEWTATCVHCRPAVQPHGEPVAWLAQAIGKDGEVYRNTARPTEITLRDVGFAWGQGVIDRFTIVIKPLYAEQPAPVAVVLPERRQESGVGGADTTSLLAGTPASKK